MSRPAPAIIVLLAAAPAAAAPVGGIVLDRSGRPLADVPITVESTVFHAMYVHGKTDRAGRYRVEVPNGSWVVHAQIAREYEGQRYLLDLAPDDARPFAGTAGAVRNFSLRIEGPRPEPQGGHYGGQVTLYHGSMETWFELADVELTFVPDGPLVDGSRGRTIRARPAGDRIDDVPVGRYTVTATHPKHGRMLVRVRNRGDFAASAAALFGPAYPGATRFGLELEVQPAGQSYSE
jgi:hypothetical protein